MRSIILLHYLMEHFISKEYAVFFEFIKNNLMNKKMIDFSWEFPLYSIVSCLVLILVQPIASHFSIIIPKAALFDASVIVVTLTFLNSIYFEYVTNRKYSLKSGLYANEIHKLKHNISSMIVYVMSLMSVFSSYILTYNMSEKDIISILFILSITFIPIVYIMISKVKYVEYYLKSIIKEFLYKDKDIKNKYAEIEIDLCIKFYLSKIRCIKDDFNLSFELLIAKEIYNRLKQNINKKEIKLKKKVVNRWKK